jgi:UDP-glucuronate decarboxylase
MHPDDGRVVSNFIVQALKGEDITIYGDGKQTRSFCYVSDLIDGMIKFMNSSREITGPMNLGNPTEFSIVELAEQVIKLTNSKSKLVMHPLPSDDPRQRKPDISLASKSINWAPSIELKSGLTSTIEYFESVIGRG